MIDLNDDLRVIGKVVQSLIEGEYSDFESTGTDDFTAQLEQTISRLNSNLKIFRWFMYARFVDEKGMIGLFLTQEAPTDDEIKQLPLFVNAIGDNQCGFARLLP